MLKQKVNADRGPQRQSRSLYGRRRGDVSVCVPQAIFWDGTLQRLTGRDRLLQYLNQLVRHGGQLCERTGTIFNTIRGGIRSGAEL